MPDAAATIESVLCGLLAEHGVRGDAACRISSRLLREYPLVRRVGERAVRLQLCAEGMAPEEAREAVLELLAFELLGRVSYERALAIVRERADGRDPVAPCLRAAGLRRQLTTRVRLHEPRPIGTRIVRAAMSWFGTSR